MRQTFNRLTIGKRMTDRRVAGRCFDIMNGALIGSANQRLLDAAVLIPQRNFQMKDMLAVALKTKMPRFNNSRMYRADRDLMGLRPFHLKKIRYRGIISCDGCRPQDLNGA